MEWDEERGVSGSIPCVYPSLFRLQPILLSGTHRTRDGTRASDRERKRAKGMKKEGIRETKRKAPCHRLRSTKL